MANIERSDDPLPAYVQDTADAYDLVPGALAQRFKDERNIAREQLRGAVEALRKIAEGEVPLGQWGELSQAMQRFAADAWNRAGGQ